MTKLVLILFAVMVIIFWIIFIYGLGLVYLYFVNRKEINKEVIELGCTLYIYDKPSGSKLLSFTERLQFIKKMIKNGKIMRQPKTFLFLVNNFWIFWTGMLLIFLLMILIGICIFLGTSAGVFIRVLKSTVGG